MHVSLYKNNGIQAHLLSIRFTRFPLIPAVKLYQIASTKIQTKQIPLMADDFSHLRLYSSSLDFNVSFQIFKLF